MKGVWKMGEIYFIDTQWSPLPQLQIWNPRPDALLDTHGAVDLVSLLKIYAFFITPARRVKILLFCNFGQG